MKILKIICLALASVLLFVPLTACNADESENSAKVPESTEKPGTSDVPDTSEITDTSDVPDTSEVTDTSDVPTETTEKADTTETPEATTEPETTTPPEPVLMPAEDLKASKIKSHFPMSLWPEGNIPYDIKGASVTATISAYLVDGSDEAVIIFPGGGYFKLAPQGEEGAGTAQAYNKAGISAFVVSYRYKSQADPVSAYDGRATLADGQRAVQFVRYYADTFGIDKDKIAVCGFSAGGHLAMLTCQHEPEENLVGDVIGAESSKPNACILAYAVTTLGDGTYRTMPPNFLGSNATNSKEIAKYSYGHNIEAMPDTFAFYSVKDTSVIPSKNTDALAKAMRDAGKNITVKSYSDGAHGVGLGTQYADFSKWHGDSVTFLKSIGF